MFYRKLEFNPKLRSEVSEMIQKEFPGKDHKKLLSQVESIFETKFRHLISIFELDPNRNAEELDEAVLKAFLQANECHKMAKLCLSWNRVDIAKNYIFNDSFSGEVKKFYPICTFTWIYLINTHLLDLNFRWFDVWSDYEESSWVCRYVSAKQLRYEEFSRRPSFTKAL